MNRITAASDNTGNYNVSNITYDKMGNIQSLTRNGWQNGSYPNMDVLDYDYSGNQLTKIRDDGNDGYGFKDSTTDDQDYWYDSNGNITRDDNKGITSIEYNYLNLPTKVTVNGNGNNGTIDYVYDADGIKLSKIKTEGGSTSITDYDDGFVYENGSLKQFDQPEGYVEPDGSGWRYVYQYKDHLGNVRITYADDNDNGSIDGASEIRREQNYYPYGLEHKGYNGTMYGAKNNLKTYQGQEFTEDLGLDTYEFKYRMHDPSIGRFWQIDPLAEDYTYNGTYNFAENRVIDGIELEGLEHLSHTVYSVHKDSDGNYNASYDRSVTQRDAGDWSGTKSQNTYNVFGSDGNVTAIYSGDNSLSNMNKAGITLSSVKNREVTAGDIIEGAKNNKEFQKAGETLKNVGSAATIVISGGSLGGASLLGKVVLGSGIVTSADDLTSEVTSNGQTVMENTIGEGNTAKVKTVVGAANVVSGGTGVVTSKTVVNKVVNATGTVLDAASTKENAEKAIKDDDKP